MSGLVLSIFPGADLLGLAFEREGWCVVHGPDVLFGRSVRDFHPPAGVFDGVIGGDPCQTHSALANLVRAKGLQPTFPDMTPEYRRVVEEAQPAWFLRENVPAAPDVAPDGYAVTSFLLCNSTLDRGDGFSEAQMRTRRFWFGVRGAAVAPDLRRWVRYAALELPNPARTVIASHGETPYRRDGDAPRAEKAAAKARTVAHEGGGAWYDNRNRVKVQAVTHRSEAVPVKLGGSGKLKATAVTGAHQCSHRPKGGHGERYTVAEMLEYQGLPPDFLEHSPFTVSAVRKLVGNGVPIPMGRAIAGAVRRALEVCGDARRVG